MKLMIDKDKKSLNKIMCGRLGFVFISDTFE